MLSFDRKSPSDVISQHDLRSTGCQSDGAAQRDEAGSQALPQLVLLFGSPRSGTTYLAKLLDCAPFLGYMHEPLSKGHGLLIHRAIGIVSRGGQLDSPFIHDITLDLVHHLPRFSKPPFFRKRFERIPYAIASSWFLQRFFDVSIPHTGRALDLKHLRLLLLKDGLAPFSQRLCGALHARMIVMLRHPCGVVNSMLRGEQIGAMGRSDPEAFWSHHSAILSALGYTADDLTHMEPEELHALRWLVTNYPVLAWMNDPAIRVITYEELIQNPESAYRALCRWLGVPVAQRAIRLMQHSSRPFSEWIRYFLGPRFLYYSIIPRGADLDCAWQTELTPDSIARILRVVRPFPLDRFWPHVAQ
jgi:hypothetical protein